MKRKYNNHMRERLRRKPVYTNGFTLMFKNKIGDIIYMRSGACKCTTGHDGPE